LSSLAKDAKKTLPKAQWTRGLSSAYQITSSYTNLDQIPKFKISTKYQLHDLTKPQQENTDQTLVSKFCLNLNFKLFTKPCAQSRDKI